MRLTDMESSLPAMADYPAALFDVRLPKGCRVGCGRAYFRGRLIRGFFLRRIEEAFKLLPEKDYRSALDLGTGAGFYLPLLSRVAGRVLGADINPVLGLTRQMIRKKAIGNVELAKSDALRLPFRPGSFDLVFCLSLIEHIEDQDAALREWARVLEPNGVLILGYPMQSVAQGTFEWLNARWQRARLFIKLSPAKALRTLKEARGFAHNHVSDFRDVRQKAARQFDVRSSATVRLLGLPVYEILMAVRTSS